MTGVLGGKWLIQQAHGRGYPEQHHKSQGRATPLNHGGPSHTGHGSFAVGTAYNTGTGTCSVNIISNYIYQ